MDLHYHFRDPVEVFQAAMGDPKPLAEYLRSEERLTLPDREALALLIEGQLTPPKRKRGQRSLSYLDTDDSVTRSEMKNAEFLVKHIMAKAKEAGEGHGIYPRVLEYVAEHDCLDIEKLDNYIKRSATSKEVRDDASELPRLVVRFHQWMHEQGLLPAFPRKISKFRTIYRRISRDR